MTQPTFCLIPARKGSQRLPGKNKRPFNGKPLFLWTLEAAIGSGVFADIWLSSDDPDILELGRAQSNILLDHRPPDLSGPKVSGAELLRYAIATARDNNPRLTRFCLLQPTSPLRRDYQVKEAVALLDRPGTDFVVGVAEYASPPQFALSIENGVHPAQEGFLTRITRTQDVPRSFHPAGGIFAGSIEAFLASGSFYGPRTAAYQLNRVAAIDINTEEDFAFAEMIARARETANR